MPAWYCGALSLRSFLPAAASNLWLPVLIPSALEPNLLRWPEAAPLEAFFLFPIVLSLILFDPSPMRVTFLCPSLLPLTTGAPLLLKLCVRSDAAMPLRDATRLEFAWPGE